MADIFNLKPDDTFPEYGEVEIGGMVVEDYQTGRAIPAVFVRVPSNPFVGPPEALERIAGELLKAATIARQTAGTMARLKNTEN